jgi:tRNA dimethylallyltransferase
MEQRKKLILLAGPTCSGKSQLAVNIAQHLNGEIINADSMQIYKEISILNSAPTEEQKKNIKHHLYGFNSVKQKFSTGHWLKMSQEIIQQLWDNNKVPVIVGGTGLYFKALTDGLVKIPEIPEDVRLKTRELHKEIGQEKFFNKLTHLDPLVKNSISPSDTQRTMRAYEVIMFTNKSLFEFIKDTKSNFNENIFKKLFINNPKPLLDKKIKNRVDQMFIDGAIQEVENFLKMNIYYELSANKIIGIREVRNYLAGKSTLFETKDLITKKTRQYAKRQFTWARGHMKSWEKIYSSNINDLLKISINKIS